MAREEEDELEASAVSTSREADSQDGAQQESFRFSLDEGRFASSGVSQKRSSVLKNSLVRFSEALSAGENPGLVVF
jgi:hypothetical protein